jgi:hypothetical protein
MSKEHSTLPKLTADAIRPLTFEIGQLFTPSTPIKLADLFAGRGRQIDQLISAVAEPGRHAILCERGVGKTLYPRSLSISPRGPLGMFDLDRFLERRVRIGSAI